MPQAPRFAPGGKVVLLHQMTFLGEYGSMIMPAGSIQTIIDMQGGVILVGDHDFQAAVHENDIAPAPSQ